MKVQNPVIATLAQRFEVELAATKPAKAVVKSVAATPAPRLAAIDATGKNAITAELHQAVDALDIAQAELTRRAASSIQRAIGGVTKPFSPNGASTFRSHAVFFGEAAATELLQQQAIEEIVRHARTLEGTPLGHLVQHDDISALVGTVHQDTKELRATIDSVLYRGTKVSALFQHPLMSEMPRFAGYDLRVFFNEVARLASDGGSSIPQADAAALAALARALDAGKGIGSLSKTVAKQLQATAFGDMIAVLRDWEGREPSPIDVASRARRDHSAMKHVGDFERVAGTDQVRLVTSITRTYGSTHCNPRLSDPRLNQVVTYPIDTPVIETLAPAALTAAIKANARLQAMLEAGDLAPLVELGLVDTTREKIDVRKSASAAIDDLLRTLDAANGNEVYIVARALVAKAAVAPNAPEIRDVAATVSARDWMPSLVPVHIARALTGDAAARRDAIAFADNQAATDTRSRLIAAWSIYAGMPSAKEDLLQHVVKWEATLWYDMGSQVNQAIAILSPPGARSAIFDKAERAYARKNHMALINGALMTMAIAAPAGPARHGVYEQGLRKLQHDRRDSIQDGLLIVALTAQTDDERQTAFELATRFSTSSWHNYVRGAAALALGILACPDRERALRVAAAALDPQW